MILGGETTMTKTKNADTKAAHTPGPWVTENINDEACVDVVLGYKVPEQGNPVLLGSFFHDEDDAMPPVFITRKQATANARLAAAAPELLAALERLNNKLVWIDTIRAYRPDDDIGNALTQARDALVKAGRPGF
jgi:hypothetical protein